MTVTTRRQIVVGLGCSAVWPFAARAQRIETVRRVGVLMNYAATQPAGRSRVEIFSKGLLELGWIEGKTIRVDVRWNAGDAGLARTFAAQLIGLMPDVILASSTTNLVAVQQLTTTIPIVFLSVTDPLAQGFVESVSRPGGNITGFSNNEFSLGGKWLALLKEAAPALATAAVMFNPDTAPQSKFYMQAIEDASRSLSVRVIVMPVRTPAEIESSVSNFAHEIGGGLILPTDSFTRLHQMLIADVALRYRLPSISYGNDFAAVGGLMTYGTPDSVDQFRRAASYVDRILKGAKPGDLPIQGADRYTLIINLNTAKALGLSIPLTLRGRADDVIE